MLETYLFSLYPHTLKCVLIEDWLNRIPCGSNPQQREYAKAIEKRPQSALPICLWTSTSLIVKLEDLDFNITAIWGLREGENAMPGEQSYTSTVSAGQNLLETHSQWLPLT